MNFGRESRHAYRVLEKSRSTCLSLDVVAAKKSARDHRNLIHIDEKDPLLSSGEEKRQGLKKGKSFDFLEEREIRTRSFHGYIGR